MKNDAMLNRAKQLVVDYFNAHVDVTDGKKLTMEDVFIVWFSKTLQNWKALVSTTVSDGMYYEITHDGDDVEIVFLLQPFDAHGGVEAAGVGEHAPFLLAGGRLGGDLRGVVKG